MELLICNTAVQTFEYSASLEEIPLTLINRHSEHQSWLFKRTLNLDLLYKLYIRLKVPKAFLTRTSPHWFFYRLAAAPKGDQKGMKSTHSPLLHRLPLPPIYCRFKRWYPLASDLELPESSHFCHTWQHICAKKVRTREITPNRGLFTNL